MAPKIRRPDIHSPSKLDRIASSLLSASESHITTGLEEDGLSGKREEAVCKKAIEKWTTPAASRLKDNVTFNGVSWKSATKKGKRDSTCHRVLAMYISLLRKLTSFVSRTRPDLEKLDTQLQTKVSNLSQTIDILMEEAVTNRKEAPLRHAEALRARMEALEYVRERMAKQWISIEENGWDQESLDEDEVRRILLQGQDEQQMRRVFETAVGQAELLAEVSRLVSGATWANS